MIANQTLISRMNIWLDWNTDNETEIVNKVVTETEENDIILLHDCYLSSVKAALRIIDIMQEKEAKLTKQQLLVIQ